MIKFGLSEKHTRFEKKSSLCFGRLLSKCAKHEKDFFKYCVFLRKSELYQKALFFLEKQLQIENSGFVKTCDEHARK